MLINGISITYYNVFKIVITRKLTHPVYSELLINVKSSYFYLFLERKHEGYKQKSTVRVPVSYFILQGWKHKKIKEEICCLNREFKLYHPTRIIITRI